MAEDASLKFTVEPKTVTTTEGTPVHLVGSNTVTLSTIWIGNVPPRTVTFDTRGGTMAPGHGHARQPV